MELAARLEFGDLLMPVTILSSLPWMLVVAWVARRLLGLGPGRFSSTLIAGFAGWLATGGVFLLAMRRELSTSKYVLIVIVSGVLFTMLAVVALELGARRRIGVAGAGVRIRSGASVAASHAPAATSRGPPVPEGS